MGEHITNIDRPVMEPRRELNSFVMALETSGAFWVALVEAAPDALFLVDRRGVIGYLNRQAERLFGYTRADLVGKPLGLLLPEELRDAHQAKMVGYFDDPQPRRLGSGLRLFAQARDGRKFPVDVALSPVTRDGELEVIAALRDVSEQHAADQRLRASRANVRAILSALPDLVMELDLEGRVVDAVTSETVSLFPTYQDVVGKSLEEAFDPDTAGNLRMLAARASVISDPPVVAELRIHNDDEAQWVEVRLAPKGEAGVVAIVRDITDRVEARRHQSALLASEQSMARAQKMDALGQLAGGIAHDFNNLLTTILGNLDLVSADLAPGAPHASELGAAMLATQRAGTLTGRLLAFARNAPLVLAPRDLNTIVERAELMLARMLIPRISLVVVSSEEPAVVRADEAQLEQLLFNLALNAHDAMPGGGELRIGTEITAAEVVLTVSDTGQGMSADVLARAFDPFFTTKPEGQGTGLGLATCRGIVEALEGQIIVQSTPDQGTRFECRFPRCDEGPRLPAATPDAHGSESVLLVEDDPWLLDVASRALAQRGFACAGSARVCGVSGPGRAAGSAHLARVRRPIRRSCRGCPASRSAGIGAGKNAHRPSAEAGCLADHRTQGRRRGGARRRINRRAGSAQAVHPWAAGRQSPGAVGPGQLSCQPRSSPSSPRQSSSATSCTPRTRCRRYVLKGRSRTSAATCCVSTGSR